MSWSRSSAPYSPKLPSLLQSIEPQLCSKSGLGKCLTSVVRLLNSVIGQFQTPVPPTGDDSSRDSRFYYYYSEIQPACIITRYVADDFVAPITFQQNAHDTRLVEISGARTSSTSDRPAEIPAEVILMDITLLFADLHDIAQTPSHESLHLSNSTPSHQLS